MKTTIVVLSLLGVAFSAVPVTRYSGVDHDAPILSQVVDLTPEGSYRSSFETGNGILVHEQGTLKNYGRSAEEVSAEASGSFQYTSPDGTPVHVDWVANENGFQPQGEHLPTPPPIPQAILRSLDWIAAHPQPLIEPHLKQF